LIQGSLTWNILENGEQELSTDINFPKEADIRGSRRRATPAVLPHFDKDDSFSDGRSNLGLADTHL